MDNRVSKVKITIGNAQAEIEAPVERLKEAVEQVISALEASIGRVERPSFKDVEGKPKRVPVKTCRTILEEMLGEGFFNEGKTLRQVSEEVARRGYTYDSTAVAHVLLDMIRQGTLERSGPARRYVYRIAKEGGEPAPIKESTEMRQSKVERA